MVARDARDAIAKQIRGVDINSILADTINGDVYARDPGIVFPDPEPEGNGTDFNSLLDSVFGAEGEEEGEGEDISNLLAVLLGDDDEEGTGGFNNTDDIDPDTLASLGLDGVGSGSNSSESDDDDPLAGIDDETLALFGFTPEDRETDGDTEETEMADDKDNSDSADSDDPLAGFDDETLALFGFTPEDREAVEDAEEQAETEKTGDKNSDSTDSDDPLAGVDAETLALFGFTSEEPEGNGDGVGGKSAAGDEVPSGPTAAAVELQQILGRDGGLQLEADNSTASEGASLFDAEDNNSFFDSDRTAAAPAGKSKAAADLDSLFDAEDNNSFFDRRRRRRG